MNQLTVIPKYRLLPPILIGCAFLLRIYNLNYEGLWNDELFTADTANPHIGFGQVIHLLQIDIHPPLHNLLSNLWSRLFSYSDTSLRMFNVLWGLLGVVSIYQLAKTLFNKRVAFITLVLVVVNSFLIRYSQEVRAYAMFFVLINYSMLYLVKLSRGEYSAKNMVSYGVITAAMLYTHYFGLFIFVFQGLAVILLTGYKDVIKHFKYWLTSFLIPIALFSLWIPSLLDHLEKKVNPWRDRPTPALFYDYLKEFFNDYILSLTSLFLFITTIILVIFYRFLKDSKWIPVDVKNHRKILLLLVLWVLVYFGIPYLKSSLSTSMMIPRYFIGMIAPILLILAFYISLLTSTRYRRGVLIGIFIYCLLVLFLKERPYYTQTTSYREIVKDASEINNEAYVLFVSNHRRYLNYYLGQYNFRRRNGYFEPFAKALAKDKPNEYFLMLDLRLTPKNFKNSIPVVDGYQELESKIYRNKNNIRTARLVRYKRNDSL